MVSGAGADEGAARPVFFAGNYIPLKARDCLNASCPRSGEDMRISD